MYIKVLNIKNKVMDKIRSSGVRGFLVAVIRKLYIFTKTILLMSYYKNVHPTYGLNQTERREKKVIVSLTSFPERFSTLHICIKSLLRQSYKPDKIILYLGDDALNMQLSENVLDLVQFGLEIAHRPDNLKPHKKYFYAMQEYPNDVIITVDDDIIYERNMLSSLVSSYFSHPNAVSARRVHKMTKGADGIIEPYMQFNHECRTEKDPSMSLVATGVAGILYPPSCLPCEAFNINSIKKLCLNADDIWLKFMQIKNNIPVVWVPSGRLKSVLINIPQTQHVALAKTNTGLNGENDLYISKLEKYFNIQLCNFCN